MTTPTTPRPAPEAVEAARRYAKDEPMHDGDASFLGEDDPYSYGMDVTARILATEIEWLRYEAEQQRDTIQRQGVDLILFTGEIANLRAQLKSRCGECGAKLQ